MGPENSTHDAPSPRQTAAPAALIGIGAMGRRLATRVQDRFGQEAPPNAESLLVLTPPEGDSLPAVVGDAARRLLCQRSVRVLEERFSIRRPARRYLTLHLVFAAALAETSVDVLLECLEAAASLQHPPAGLEVLFLLDMTDPQAPGEVAPNAASALHQLEEAGRRERERQATRWSASARLRILLAHPHRADGSWLDHPCLNPLASQEERGEDEFEDTLAAALAGHLASGAFFDGLAVGDDTRPFALWGRARDVLPREQILRSAADLLLADALERTVLPEPGAAAESLVEQEALDDWQAWVRTRDDVLLDRRSLLKRLLGAGLPGALTVEDAGPGRPPHRPFLPRLLHWFFSAAEPPSDTGEKPLRVRIGLGAPGWQRGDPATWPAALQRLDIQGGQECEGLIAALRDQDRPRQEAEAVCLALARCVDVCVRRHLGGVGAARALVDEAAQSARDRIRASGTISCARPEQPDGLGLPHGADMTMAWEAYQERCARQPTWPAALTAGLSSGAVGMTALATFGLPALLWGGLWVALCVTVAGLRQAWTLGRLQRLGEFLRESLRAKYGRRLLEWAERAAGDPAHDGVYQAVLHYLDNAERPVLEQFEAKRAATVARLRQNPPFPLPIGTDGFFADSRAVPNLHALARETGGEIASADDARSLLRQQDMFADWRVPTLEPGEAASRSFVRRTRFGRWERSACPLGDFMRALQPAHASEDEEAVFAHQVRGHMDRLALRALPLALQPPTHPERDEAAEDGVCAKDVRVSVTVAAPASLNWHAADDAGVSDPSQVPVDSGVRDLTAWFGGAFPSERVITDESDQAACLTLLSGLGAEDALSAFSLLPAVPAHPAPAPNGNGHTPHSASRRALQEEAPGKEKI